MVKGGSKAVGEVPEGRAHEQREREMRSLEGGKDKEKCLHLLQYFRMPEKTQKGINTDSYANMPYSPSKSKEKTGNYKVGKQQKSCENRT